MLNFDYKKLCDEINDLKNMYPFLEVTCEGKSINNRCIFCITFGNGDKEVLINGAHHGLEWITSPLLTQFLRDCCDSYTQGKRYKGYDMREIYNNIKLYIMPMINPDGVDIVINQGKRWQANARGVDLNHNYNARWDLAQKLERENGIVGPRWSRYGGPAPESEPETRAVTDFVRQHNIQRLIALHTQGEEIYYSFEGLEPPQSLSIALQMAAKSGYTVSRPESLASYGGCKDWFISEYRRPGFTIEAGRGTNPLPIEMFDEIYQKLSAILLVGIDM
ncbi:MAG: M14 family metallocarboxypeptidase [Eubacteriales bacterium]|nr:M14 family metallocarboxypeptidase [Eubacteriales bacterium]